jgi:hypothetical protein
VSLLSLALSLAGVWLVAAFLIVVAADARDWWACAQCGDLAEHPIHYACAAHGSRCRQPSSHHEYAKPAWPFVVVTVAMFADAVAIVVFR